MEMLPDNLNKSMSDRWGTKVNNTKVLEQQAKQK